ncbi:glycosyltransferase family 1 protein [Aquabacterium sp. A3]|uniref:glycosyltransferase family 4 protein n=1 Tax=Aquabacterium sp. A3 TaxID=3132829 RepID=UPI0031193280
MKILFDVAELAPGMGKSMGIYNYAKRLLEHIPPLLPDGWELHVACNAGGQEDFSVQHEKVHLHRVLNQQQPGALRRQLWIRWGAQALSCQVGANIYFTPKGFLPGFFGKPAGLKSVAVVHDLIPLWYAKNYPDQFSWLEKMIVNGGLLRTVRFADQLIVISQATADDVLSMVRRDASSMNVVHNGIPLVTPRREPPRKNPYIFAMASSLPHKNLNGLLASYECYRNLSADPLPLIICGVADPGLCGVEVVSGLDEQSLHTYYAHAEAFLFLSLIEGFGFPPLEALSHGTPVVCSDIPALREVVGDQAIFVSPDDPSSVASALLKTLSENRVLRAGRQLAQNPLAPIYSWDRCAKGVISALKSVASPTSAT